ncbi:hypothetical protein GCK72_015345 [Caenorhabditis remanei]|uniref:Uncharacterized protein n=2 Tax=Caenorhabditis remanei TaxID=31234 RepID=A0A6A5GWL3_CAERE|nr:hypothetical protein GCK72_015345 [Caenorhabditis remanei]KAF1758885.1 hypothetical protein GCK72_015345 [Caenorhabditis remanei]
MLLRRSLFILDVCVLLAVVLFLVFLPAERCVKMEVAANKESADCSLHPVHYPDFSLLKSSQKPNGTHLKAAKHHVTVCHRLKWDHYSFWDNMYLILLPAITCFLLILYTLCEICEFDMFVGTVQSTGLVILSLFSVIYTIAVITHEKSRIQTDWPLLTHAQLFGATAKNTSVDVPKTWEYSIAMCLLSALFKIGRILIQHFIGDQKMSLDEDIEFSLDKHHPAKNFGNFESAEVAGTTRMLNESRYSKIENID